MRFGVYLCLLLYKEHVSPEEMIMFYTLKVSKESYINKENPLFSIINEGLKNLGINEYSCFMIYALIFVICATIFMRDFKQYAKYMFPLFLIGFMNFEENMIRSSL